MTDRPTTKADKAHQELREFLGDSDQIAQAIRQLDTLKTAHDRLSVDRDRWDSTAIALGGLADHATIIAEAHSPRCRVHLVEPCRPPRGYDCNCGLVAALDHIGRAREEQHG